MRVKSIIRVGTVFVVLLGVAVNDVLSDYSIGLPTANTTRRANQNVPGSGMGEVAVTAVFAFGIWDNTKTELLVIGGDMNDVSVQATPVLPGDATGNWIGTINPPGGNWTISPLIPPMNLMRDADHAAQIQGSGQNKHWIFDQIVTPN